MTPTLASRTVTRRTLISSTAAASFLLASGAATTPALADRPKLRKGSSGAAVRDLQESLSRLGYWCGTADGKFGHLTVQAIYALQKAAGIGVDAVVGPKTWSALDRGVRPKARATSGTTFEIDLDRQLLLCVAQGRSAYILNTSTGSGKRYYSGGRWKTATTPKGRFRMYRFHSSGWQTGPLGSMYRPGYYDRGWAIHGSTSIPPYPDSHGCARISTGAADMLWRLNWFKPDRKVHVY